MTNELTLCFLETDLDAIEMAELYWQREADGSWTYTVKQIGEYLGIPQRQVSTKVAAVAEAFVVDNRCTLCGNPQSARSRSDFTKIANVQQMACSACLDLARRLKEEQAALQLKKERDRLNAVWLRETSKDHAYDYGSMEYLDAFYAFVLLVSSKFDETTGEIVLPEADVFSPAPEALRKVVVQLHNQRVLLFGKKTPPNAFVVDEKDGQSFSYYPARVSWRFSLPLFGESYNRILNELSSVVDSREEDEDYSSAISGLWWHIGEAEGKRYLDLQLDAYGLSVESSDKLNEAIRYCLQHFSIPKLRYLIWKVAKDIAAYSARRDVHRKQAINSIPGSLIRICDRALADQWEIHPWVLKWDEEEALITTMLFDRVLRTGAAGFKAMTGESILSLTSSLKAIPKP